MTSRSLSLHVLMLICVGFAVLPFAVAEEVLTVQVTADSENTGYDAARAMDGDPATMWHTQFSAPPSYTGAVRPAIPFRCGYGAGCSREHFNALPPTGTDETSIAAPGPVVKPSNACCRRLNLRVTNNHQQLNSVGYGPIVSEPL